MNVNDLWLDFDPLHHLAPILIGLLLLVWGRRLYWLALGTVGFLLGSWLAVDVLTLGDRQVELGLGLVFGILGAVAVVLVQKIAIRIAGLILGGGAALWLAEPHQAQLEVWFWPLVIVGAVIGLILAAALFRWALILISSLAGASLISGLFAASPHQIWIFLALFVIGVLLQSRGQRAAKE